VRSDEEVLRPSGRLLQAGLRSGLRAEVLRQEPRWFPQGPVQPQQVLRSIGMLQAGLRADLRPGLRQLLRQKSELLRQAALQAVQPLQEVVLR